MSLSELILTSMLVQLAGDSTSYYCTIKTGFVRAETPDQQASVVSTKPGIKGERMGFIALINQISKKITISQSSHADLFPIANLDLLIDNKSSVISDKLISINHISASWKIDSTKCKPSVDCEIHMKILDYGRPDFLYLDLEYPVGFKSKKLISEYKSFHGACLPLTRKPA